MEKKTIESLNKMGFKKVEERDEIIITNTICDEKGNVIEVNYERV